jgi:hypothetical protein
MIQTKQRGEDIKKMAQIVDRLQFALSIPSQIEEHFEKEDFGKIVNNYRRTKAFMSETDSTIFQSVYQLVMTQVVEVRERMFDILADPQTPYEEKQKIIGHLYQLDAPEDPAWYYLRTYHSYIISKIEDCLVGIEDGSDTESLDIQTFLQKRQQQQQLDEKTYTERYTSDLHTLNEYNEQNPTINVEKVKKASETLRTHLPYFWKHAKAVLDGKYDKKVRSIVKNIICH